MKRKKISKELNIKYFLLRGIIFILLIVSIISLAFNTGSQKEETKIYWDKNLKLTWEDFMAKPPAGSKHGAISCVSMSQSYSVKNNTLVIDARSSFDKSKSWSKKDEQTNEALKHEQGHFDIAEIYARRLRKEVTEFKFKSKNLKEKSEGIIHKVNSDYFKYDNLYDKETNHHINRVKQIEWNEKIEKELNELEKYSEPHLSIKVK